MTVPAGSYEFKVRLNGSWDENYGAGGVAGGPNVPLALENAAQLTFSYDHTSHRVGVAPSVEQPGLTRADRRLARTSLRKDLTREQFYFVMADRFANGNAANDDGGYGGDRLVSGLDPTHKGFYHGGDLKGLLDKLDYIEGLGTTAIWMTPSFKNKPVQGAPGTESAGYHGYWITDFTQIDPHLGTNADLKTLVDAAHARGIKVFFDIITNHTADVLDYTDEAYAGGEIVPYKSKAEAPYVDTSGEPFDDRDYALGDTFPAVDTELVPVRAGVPVAGRRDREDTGLAERPDDVPQPGHVELHRREQRVRRLPRRTAPGPGRPLDGAARGRQRHGGHLRGVGPEGRRGRVPHRHRQAREHGVLAAVRTRRCRATPRRSATTTSSCSARSSTPTRSSCPATRPREGSRRPSTSVSRPRPSASPRARPPRPCATSTPVTTGSPTPTPTPTRCRRSSETTTWAASGASSRRRGSAATRCLTARGSRTRSCTSPAASRSSTTATSRASSVTAATRTRARTCSRRGSGPTTTTT